MLVKETIELVPAKVQAAPERYERIGEERTFEVDVVPPQLFKREIVRPKYRVKDDRSVAPARPVAGGYALAGLLAWIALSKYVDHLPLYRLKQMSSRWGGDDQPPDDVRLHRSDRAVVAADLRADARGALGRRLCAGG